MINDDKIRAFMKRSGWDQLSEEELRQVVSKELDDLIEQGLVERLIGEDGQFYYRTTKQAKQQRKPF
jgi:phosphoglycolate phosphatase-like HAD superfamily hydrolase